MTAPYYEDDRVTILAGDCLDVLATLPDASVDSVVTDPPYGLEFMGREWDGADGFRRSLNPADAGRDNAFGRASRTSPEYRAGSLFQEWCEAWARECLRVLKPGGHLLAFGGTRTWHRLACAVEDAGFEVRDSIAWMYGSGFPKSLDVSKAIDKAAGAERDVVGIAVYGDGHIQNSAESIGYHGSDPARDLRSVTAPATDDSRTWQGWGTALKPAFEPIVVARKPLIGTVAGNVLAHGTGALNVDACRIEATDSQLAEKYASVQNAGARANSIYGTDDRDRAGAAPHAAGRWPANVVLDESQAAELDQQSGVQRDGTAVRRNGGGGADPDHVYAGGWGSGGDDAGFGGEGGASRFFYVAKADASERVRVNGTAHPTVKPLALMRWLVRLVTPPGGTVLEPFAGSGTTVEACILEGLRCIAIEREADYLPLIMQRINRRRDPVAAVLAAAPDDGGLFDLLEEGA